MAQTALIPPVTDPTSIFELFRGVYQTELLTASVSHFNVFGRLSRSPLTFEEMASELGLARRPAQVLLTALKSFGLILEREQKLELTDLAREHLVPGGNFDVGDYVSLMASSPGVLEMVNRLKTNQPAGSDNAKQGAAFIYREGIASAMESEQMARHLTMALAGRAKNVAPVLADKIPLEGVRTLLDVGGGTGIYSIACLQKNPQLQALVLDRPEVLKITQEMAEAYQVSDRLTLMSGDMFQTLKQWLNGGDNPQSLDTDLPKPDVILLSNVLHDWDDPQCQDLIRQCSAILPRGGRLLIHDVFLNDSLDGPLPIAMYSAALFTLTEGRAYSVKEYANWLKEVGLHPQPIIPTLIHCGVLTGLKA